MKTLVIWTSVAANVALAIGLGTTWYAAELTHVGASPLHREATPAAVSAVHPQTAWPTQTVDLKSWVARLKAAGFPRALIREIIRMETYAKYQKAIDALVKPDPNTPYWKIKPLGLSPDRMAQLDALVKERTKDLRALLDDPALRPQNISNAQRQKFGNLSYNQIQALQLIEDDYAEMAQTVVTAANGIMLKQDRDVLALLATEKRSDLAAVLSPAELDDYEMRSSPMAATLRERIAPLNPTTDEFRAIFQIQQNLAAQVSDPQTFTDLDIQARQALIDQYKTQLKTALGDARYADYLRAVDPQYQELAKLASAQNLPPDAAPAMYDLRSQVAEKSNEIFDNAALSLDQKRAALQQLAESTRAQYVAALGADAASSYLNRYGGWLKTIGSGAAIAYTDTGTLPLVWDHGIANYTAPMRVRALHGPRPHL